MKGKKYCLPDFSEIPLLSRGLIFQTVEQGLCVLALVADVASTGANPAAGAAVRQALHLESSCLGSVLSEGSTHL